MKKVFSIIGISLLIACVASLGPSPCPIQSSIGSLISARITVSQQLSLVTLVQGTDIQCYNYSLPYAFSSAPDVAVAVSDFEARASTDLFFSIKPLQTGNTYVPFLIRTQWKYTNWNKINFNFIAEDRKDFESGYYQIDSGSLGGCDSGKNIQVILPFRQIGRAHGPISYSLFLHGFEISSIKYTSDALSPFEIQIADSSINSTGIAVLITTTTITQVQAIHLSYIVWSQTKLNIATGNYTYDASIPETLYQITYSPSQSIGPNYARIFGFNGLIINYNYQNISLSTTWTGSQFNFDFGVSQKQVQYFTFQYIFFIGSECSSCFGYDYMNNGVCAQTCPAGSYPTAEKTCITCGDGYYWDGGSCIKVCPTGQILNPANNQCVCPVGTNWTGSTCLNCTLGRVFNPNNKLCECPNTTRWNGYSCITAQPCNGGKEWNVYSFSCECPTGTGWNGTYCIRIKICTGGAILNTVTNQCVCPDGTYQRDGYCQQTGCSGGQAWNGSACICEQGYNWNGTVCLLCINGQVWNPVARTCLCAPDYFWNGNFCQRQNNCSGGRVFNPDYQVCLCPEGYVWNGATCIVREPCCCGQQWNDTRFQCNCPSGFNWDGKTCIYCVNGKIWDPSTRSCICQNGTQWNNQFCAVVQNCQGGTIWNQNTWACQCPSTAVWNGFYCLANPCVGGQIWDNTLKTCVCVNNMVFVNGYCVPPQQACTGGQIWDQKIFGCKCPHNMWYNGTNCVPIQNCVGNQIYNPLNNQCVCPPNLVFLATKNLCGDPTCPAGQRWDGQGCASLSCPPGSWFNGSECICPNPRDQCLPWQLWDGQNCVYYQNICPSGTKWHSLSCASNSTSCPNGYYMDANQCVPLPQRCLPPTSWDNGKCVSSGGNCPYGTVSSGNTCQPYTQCSNGQSWDSNTLQCTCPKGTGWSGKQCVVCAGGQVWNIWDGCTCPQGYFMAGSVCQKPANNMCKLIPNAYWDNSKDLCLCNPGFSVVGYQCICKGVQYSNFCDRCADRPNSQFYFGICKCNPGYTLVGSACLPNQNNGNNTASDCNVGTFFDTQQKKCLPCSDGCLQCKDCYTCITCSPDFIFDPISSLCSQKCGDGKRYVKQCDDGNTVGGDGCSSDCKIEDGFTCRGGSPNSRDNCVVYTPSSVTFLVVGQIRYNTKVVLNIKIDYLPKQLLQSTDCNDRCSQVLVANVLSGDKPISTKSSFVAGSRYTFSIQMQFGKAYMSKFSVEIKINPSLSRYYQSVSISNKFTVEVNPSQLTLARRDNEDAL